VFASGFPRVIVAIEPRNQLGVWGIALPVKGNTSRAAVRNIISIEKFSATPVAIKG